MLYKQMDVEHPFYPCETDDILLRGGEVDRTFAPLVRTDKLFVATCFYPSSFGFFAFPNSIISENYRTSVTNMQDIY